MPHNDNDNDKHEDEDEDDIDDVDVWLSFSLYIWLSFFCQSRVEVSPYLSLSPSHSICCLACSIFKCSANLAKKRNRFQFLLHTNCLLSVYECVCVCIGYVYVCVFCLYADMLISSELLTFYQVIEPALERLLLSLLISHCFCLPSFTALLIKFTTVTL